MSEAAIKQMEFMEPTSWEKSHGERPQVPLYGLDDGLLSSFGCCSWVPTKKSSIALLYKAKFDAVVYEDAKSYNIKKVATQRVEWT